MIEFKQIIGRGTRLFDGKDYFTIYDFVKAYEHFNDEEWDGEPIEPVESSPRTTGVGEPEPEPPTNEPPEGEPEPPRKKIKVKLADGKERTIQHMMATTFWSPDGKPMSAAEFVQRLFGDLPELFKDEDELRSSVEPARYPQSLLENLSEKGYGDEQLSEIKRMIDAENSDLFDVLAYVAFALSPMTRVERVEHGRIRIATEYDEKLQTFLDFVLSQYVKEGVGELDNDKLPDLLELRYRAVREAAQELGGVAKIRDAFIGFQKYLYEGRRPS